MSRQGAIVLQKLKPVTPYETEYDSNGVYESGLIDNVVKTGKVS